jgi:translocation and assembly module TamB
MRRAVKVSAWTGAAVVLAAIALLGAVWVAGNTDSGRSLIERLTYRLTSGHVTLLGLGGSFPTRPTLRELQLRDRGGVWLTAEAVAIDWSPLELLQRRIHVATLHVQRLHMERAPVSDSSGGGSAWVPHIEVDRFAADAVELGAPLVGTPATVSLRGGLRLRSLADADGDVTAHRLDGQGDYTAHLQLDARHIDASLSVHEPASGPLEHLLFLPGLGALSANASVQGPRNALKVDVALAAGDLHAGVRGSIDLEHRSADLEYSLESPALSPRPQLAWDKIELSGDWHGPLSAATADGHLQAEGLRVGGNGSNGNGSNGSNGNGNDRVSIRSVNAKFAARSGSLAAHAVLDGLELPGPVPRLLAQDPLTLDASWALGQASRPLELTAVHPLFKLRAQTDTATMSMAEQRAVVDLNVPEVAPFAALAGQDVRGSATINARLAHAGSGDGGGGDSSIALEAAMTLTGGNARWVGPLGPRVTLALKGELTDRDITIQSLRLAGSTLNLTLSGSAARAAPSSPAAGATATATRTATAAISPKASPGSLTQGLSFLKDLQVRWQLEDSDLRRLSNDLAGTLKMSGRLSGMPASLGGDFNATSQLSVRGSEFGNVTASLQVRGLPQAPRGTIQAHGVFDGSPLNLDAALDRPGKRSIRVQVRRADWKSAHLDGDLTADAALTNSSGQLHLRVGQLGDFDRLAGESLGGSIEGSVTVLPAPGATRAQLELNGKNLKVGQLAGDLHLRAAGAADAIGLQLSAQLPELYGSPAKLSAAATLDVPGSALRVASVVAEYRGETFRLAQPALVSFSNGVRVDDLKIGAQQAVFELEGQVAPTLDLRASLKKVDPGLVNVFAPGLMASGNLEATARLEGSRGGPQGEIRVDATDLRLSDDAATGLPAVNLHASAQLANDTAALQATLTAGPGSRMTVSGDTPLKPSGSLNLKIGGKLDLGMVNPLLEARGLHAAGELAVDATVTGSSAAPQVGGGITLKDGSLRDYGRGVNLSQIDAVVVGNEAGLQIKSFKATAVSGTVAMTGSFGVLKPGMPLDLEITAKNAQPVASNLITANLDADLHVSGTARERIDVAGTVQVNTATIEIPSSLPPDVAVLDVRRRGRRAPAANAKPLVVGIDVAIRAPGQIKVTGRGLDAYLGGAIRIAGTSAEPLVSGGFDLERGTFSLGNNSLNLKEGGRVGFDGQGLRKTIDPTLDFTAETTLSDNSNVTLRITGFADAPHFDFSSSSSLAPDEIMARLLFGEPGAQLNAFQYAQVAQSLATLGGVGGSSLNPLVKLQKKLGLDRLSVGTNTVAKAAGSTENSGYALAAGRYVSKRVYVEGKQTTTGTSQVQIDIDLTKRLKLQTRLGNGSAVIQGTTPENDPGSSIGLSYQFEY